MAEKPDEVATQQDVKFQLDWDEFCCSVCLDLLREPITIPCGHTYCKSCLEGCWEGKEEFKCPQCRETFRPRPVLRRTNMVAQFLSAYGLLAVIMYLTATILWPVFQFDKRSQYRGQDSKLITVAVLTALNFLLYLADLVYTARLVFVSA